MKFSIISVLFLSVLFCQAQESKPVKTFFVKGNDAYYALPGKDVKTLDSANYIRTVSLEKNNENLYDVTEYYLDKTVKRIGNSLTNGFSPKYSGTVISYFRNGNKASEELYITGERKGISTYYYTNKQLKKRTDFGNEKGKFSETVLELNDSLGRHFLDASGTGAFEKIEENGEIVDGFYLNGKKDKIWKTVNVEKSETYFDEYDAGKYVKGKTVDGNGNIMEYNGLEVLPEFKGGLQAFGAFLSRNLHYPKEARRNKIQGRVFLSFIIEKDGSLTNAKVIRGIGAGCDEEALRVINSSPKWNPGVQRGRPVRVSYTVPIFFQLQ